MKAITKYLIGALVLTFSLSSCSDWLDVEPVSEEREDDEFSSYQGFKDALTGCYSALTSRDLYGEALTMSDIEELACLWTEPSSTTYPTYYYMYHHQYDNSYSVSAIKGIYGGLYNIVAQANKVLEHLQTDGNVINSDDSRNIITGEAYALRALCHFDALRLFGQMPQNAQKQVSLPYSLKTGIHEVAHYYGYADFCKLLESDLDSAVTMLGKSDPILEYDYYDLDLMGGTPAELSDNFFNYRRFRLNYWAVRALRARYYLYTGQTSKAYTEAMAVINAKVGDESTISLSGVADIKSQYYALPGECLFALSVTSLADYAITLTHGTTSVGDDQLHINTDMLNKQLYNGANTTSDNRYLNIWDQKATDVFGQTLPVTNKYNIPQSSTSIYQRMVPMIRLSEMYLIAMETTTDLDEANSLYKTYMASHNVNITTAFTSLDAVKEEVINEYRREFYAEGLMFYTYKRLGTTSMMFCSETMGESQYILPLPTSEYNPDETNQ
jgi:hypothetical protein